MYLICYSEGAAILNHSWSVCIDAECSREHYVTDINSRLEYQSFYPYWNKCRGHYRDTIVVYASGNDGNVEYNAGMPLQSLRVFSQLEPLIKTRNVDFSNRCGLAKNCV